jgi:Polysaccharide biosynthesis enzyme WcbI
VAFSPIANRPGYETTRLLDACQQAGVLAVSFPWLEWRGYFPHAAKRPFLARPAWQYLALLQSAARAVDQSTYRAEVAGMFADREVVLEALKCTTSVLQVHEKMHNCIITISEFVLSNFRSARLFLTPDHPSKLLYNFVVRQLSERLDLLVDDAFYKSVEEPQYGIKTPITPDVGRRLGLDLVDANYQNNECISRATVFPWEEYLELCFGIGAGASIYRATRPILLKRAPEPSTALGSDQLIPVRQGTILVAWPTASPSIGNHRRVRLAWAEQAIRRETADWKCIYVFLGHWEERLTATALQPATGDAPLSLAPPLG